jgi:hypothetical protein
VAASLTISSRNRFLFANNKSTILQEKDGTRTKYILFILKYTFLKKSFKNPVIRDTLFKRGRACLALKINMTKTKRSSSKCPMG